MRALVRFIAGLIGLALALGGTVVAIYAFYSLKNGDSGAWLVGSVGAVGAVVGAVIMQRAPRL
jgi:uncharacterized membrane protein HdeD (DUF308 family)